MIQVLERALQAVHAKHPDKLMVVRLSGIVHTDDMQALRGSAMQLCKQQKISYSRTASYEENMTFLHEMLRCINS
jgi:hypothetical protein